MSKEKSVSLRIGALLLLLSFPGVLKKESQAVNLVQKVLNLGLR